MIKKCVFLTVFFSYFLNSTAIESSKKQFLSIPKNVSTIYKYNEEGTMNSLNNNSIGYLQIPKGIVLFNTEGLEIVFSRKSDFLNERLPSKNNHNNMNEDFVSFKLKRTLPFSNKTNIGFHHKNNYSSPQINGKTSTRHISYKSLLYENFFPNSDFEIKGNMSSLFPKITVKKEENLKDVIFDCNIDKVVKADDGNLLLYKNETVMVLKKPTGYSFHNGKHVAVDINYTIVNEHSFGFTSESYLGSLFIEPEIVFSTFIGDENGDVIYDFAITQFEDLIFASGATLSPDFPVLDSNQNFAGNWDAFVTTFNNELSDIYFSSFIGGSGNDVAFKIIEYGNNSVVVAGQTSSTDFPVTDNAYQKEYAGGYYDIFLCKINLNVNEIEYSSYFGGSSHDYLGGLAVDSSNRIIISGSTSSSDFPIKTYYNDTINGDYDSYITSFEPDFSGLVFSTFVGGTDYDDGRCLTVSGYYYFISGVTYSSNFPKSDGTFQNYGGAGDLYIFRINSSGSKTHSAVFGGMDFDAGTCITFDNDDNVILAGKTYSPDFPNSEDAYDSGFNSGLMEYSDIFLLRMDRDFTELQYSTFFGGTYSDEPRSISYHSNYVLIGGGTGSGDFPITEYNIDNEVSSTSYSGFIMLFDFTTNTLPFSSVLYAAICDAVHLSDEYIYFAGGAQTNDYPSTPGAFDQFPSGTDGYMTILAFDRMAYIPHIDWSAYWSTYLSVNNTDPNNDHEIELVLMNDGDVFKTEQYFIPAGEVMNIPLTEGVCGMIRYFSSHIKLKETFVNNIEKGIAEFPLNRDSGYQLYNLFPNYTADSLTWMGLALMNPTTHDANATLYAYNNVGQVIAEKSVEIPQFSKTVGILESYFEGVNYNDISKVFVDSDTPLCGINISGQNTEKLLFTKAVTKGSHHSYYHISHIANEWESWDNLLIFDNHENKTIYVDIHLLSEGIEVLKETIFIDPNATYVYNINEHKDLSPTTGKVGRGVSYSFTCRQSYRSTGEDGIAEFVLSDEISRRLVFNFPSFISDELDWYGLAIYNTDSRDVFTDTSHIRLYAYRGGELIDTAEIYLPCHRRVAHLISNLFPTAYENGIDRVVANSYFKISGLNISGKGLSRLIFSQALTETTD